MNIGETDADGWTYVRFGDAAKAAQDGTHEVQDSDGCGGWDNTRYIFPICGKYRIREKARTITVTIPRVTVIRWSDARYTSVELCFASKEIADKAMLAIRAEMEK